jgi:hypothetical protein
VILGLVLVAVVVVGIVKPDILVNLFVGKDTPSFVWRDLVLPNNTVPMSYDLKINTYLDPEWKFTGEALINVRVSEKRRWWARGLWDGPALEIREGEKRKGRRERRKWKRMEGGLTETELGR